MPSADVLFPPFNFIFSSKNDIFFSIEEIMCDIQNRYDTVIIMVMIL